MMTTTLPKTVEETVKQITAQLTSKELEEIRNFDSTGLHFSLGIYIRNTFQPYIGKNDELILSCIKSDGVEVDNAKDKVCYGLLMKQYEGDECSRVIINELIKVSK